MLHRPTITPLPANAFRRNAARMLRLKFIQSAYNEYVHAYFAAGRHPKARRKARLMAEMCARRMAP